MNTELARETTVKEMAHRDLVEDEAREFLKIARARTTGGNPRAVAQHLRRAKRRVYTRIERDGIAIARPAQTTPASPAGPEGSSVTSISR